MEKAVIIEIGCAIADHIINRIKELAELESVVEPMRDIPKPLVFPHETPDVPIETPDAPIETKEESVSVAPTVFESEEVKEGEWKPEENSDHIEVKP